MNSKNKPMAPDGPIDQLTEREMEILRLLVNGATNLDIARQCFIAEGTVKLHVHKILAKLGVKTRGQAIVQAREWVLFTAREPWTQRSVTTNEPVTLRVLPPKTIVSLEDDEN